MIDRAKEKHFAYPAINVSSLTTANAVLKGLAESKSDGIIQVSTGGGGLCLRLLGEGHGPGCHLHRRARAPGGGALPHLRGPAHRSLPGQGAGQVRDPPDPGDREAAGSGAPESLQQPHVRRERSAPEGEPGYRRQDSSTAVSRNELILEIEAGVVGGEEDGVKGEISEKLYTTPEDTLEVARRLGTGEKAATSWRPPSGTSTACISPAR